MRQIMIIIFTFIVKNKKKQNYVYILNTQQTIGKCPPLLNLNCLNNKSFHFYSSEFALWKKIACYLIILKRFLICKVTRQFLIFNDVFKHFYLVTSLKF